MMEDEDFIGAATMEVDDKQNLAAKDSGDGATHSMKGVINDCFLDDPNHPIRIERTQSVMSSTFSVDSGIHSNDDNSYSNANSVDSGITINEDHGLTVDPDPDPLIDDCLPDCIFPDSYSPAIADDCLPDSIFADTCSPPVEDFLSTERDCNTPVVEPYSKLLEDDRISSENTKISDSIVREDLLLNAESDKKRSDSNSPEPSILLETQDNIPSLSGIHDEFIKSSDSSDIVKTSCSDLVGVTSNSADSVVCENVTNASCDQTEQTEPVLSNASSVDSGICLKVDAASKEPGCQDDAVFDDENNDKIVGNDTEAETSPPVAPTRKYFQFHLKPQHHIPGSAKGGPKFKCEVCGTVYRHRFSLKRHFIRSHVNLEFVSPIDIVNCNVNVKQLEVPNTAFNEGQKSSLTVDSEKPADNEGLSLNSENTTSGTSKTRSPLASVNSTVDGEVTGMFRCSICYQLFDTIEELIPHHQGHPKSDIVPVKKELYPCSKCNLKFARHQNYLKHLSKHKEEFKCLKCDVSFTTSAILDQHEYHHETGKYRCFECSEICDTISDMTDHMEILHSDNFNTCSICDTRFAQVSEYEMHLAKEHPESLSAPSGENTKKKGANVSKPSTVSAKPTMKTRKGGMLTRQLRKEGVNELVTTELQTKKKRKPAPSGGSKTIKEEKRPLYDSDESSDNVEDSENEEMTEKERLIKLIANRKAKEGKQHRFGRGLSFACTYCKKRFRDYARMCAHRRLAHQRHLINRRRYQYYRKPQIPEMDPRERKELEEFYANVAKNVSENLCSFIDGKETSLVNPSRFFRVIHEHIETITLKDLGFWKGFNFNGDFSKLVRLKVEDMFESKNIVESILESVVADVDNQVTDLKSEPANNPNSAVCKSETPSDTDLKDQKSVVVKSEFADVEGHDKIKTVANCDIKIKSEPLDDCDSHMSPLSSDLNENQIINAQIKTESVLELPMLGDSPTHDMENDFEGFPPEAAEDCLVNESLVRLQCSEELDNCQNLDARPCSVLSETQPCSVISESDSISELESMSRPVSECSNERPQSSLDCKQPLDSPLKTVESSYHSANLDDLHIATIDSDTVKTETVENIEKNEKVWIDNIHVSDISDDDDDRADNIEVHISDISLEYITTVNKLTANLVGGSPGYNRALNTSAQNYATIPNYSNNAVVPVLASNLSTKINPDLELSDISDDDTEQILSKDLGKGSNVEIVKPSQTVSEKSSPTKLDIQVSDISSDEDEERDLDTASCLSSPNFMRHKDYGLNALSMKVRCPSFDFASKPTPMKTILDYSLSSNKMYPISDFSPKIDPLLANRQTYNRSITNIPPSLSAFSVFAPLETVSKFAERKSTESGSIGAAVDSKLPVNEIESTEPKVSESSETKSLNDSQTEIKDESIQSKSGNSMTENKESESSEVHNDSVLNVNKIDELENSVDRTVCEQTEKNNDICQDLVTGPSNSIISETIPEKLDSNCESDSISGRFSPNTELKLERLAFLNLRCATPDVSKSNDNLTASDERCNSTETVDSEIPPSCPDTDVTNNTESTKQRKIPNPIHVFRNFKHYEGLGSVNSPLEVKTESGVDAVLTDCDSNIPALRYMYDDYDIEVVFMCLVCKEQYNNSWDLSQHQIETHEMIDSRHIQMEKISSKDLPTYIVATPSVDGIMDSVSKFLPDNLYSECLNCTKCRETFSAVDDLRSHIMFCAADPKSKSGSRWYYRQGKNHKRRRNKLGRRVRQGPKIKKTPSESTGRKRNQPTPVVDAEKVENAKRDLSADLNVIKRRPRRRNVDPDQLPYNPNLHVRRRNLRQCIDPQTCWGCGKKFTNLPLLEKHSKTCDQKHVVQQRKLLHQDDKAKTETDKTEPEHESPNSSPKKSGVLLQCPYCGKSFIYRTHLRTHLREICSIKQNLLSQDLLMPGDVEKENELLTQLFQDGEEIKSSDSIDSVKHAEKIMEQGRQKRMLWMRGFKRKVKKRRSAGIAFKRPIKSLKPKTESSKSKSPSSNSESVVNDVYDYHESSDAEDESLPSLAASMNSSKSTEKDESSKPKRLPRKKPAEDTDPYYMKTVDSENVLMSKDDGNKRRRKRTFKALMLDNGMYPEMDGRKCRASAAPMKRKKIESAPAAVALEDLPSEFPPETLEPPEKEKSPTVPKKETKHTETDPEKWIYSKPDAKGRIKIWKRRGPKPKWLKEMELDDKSAAGERFDESNEVKEKSDETKKTSAKGKGAKISKKKVSADKDQVDQSVDGEEKIDDTEKSPEKKPLKLKMKRNSGQSDWSRASSEIVASAVKRLKNPKFRSKSEPASVDEAVGDNPEQKSLKSPKKRLKLKISKNAEGLMSAESPIPVAEESGNVEAGVKKSKPAKKLAKKKLQLTDEHINELYEIMKEYEIEDIEKRFEEIKWRSKKSGPKPMWMRKLVNILTERKTGEIVEDPLLDNVDIRSLFGNSEPVECGQKPKRKKNPAVVKLKKSAKDAQKSVAEAAQLKAAAEAAQSSVTGQALRLKELAESVKASVTEKIHLSESDSRHSEDLSNPLVIDLPQELPYEGKSTRIKRVPKKYLTDDEDDAPPVLEKSPPLKPAVVKNTDGLAPGKPRKKPGPKPGYKRPKKDSGIVDDSVSPDKCSILAAEGRDVDSPIQSTGESPPTKLKRKPGPKPGYKRPKKSVESAVNVSSEAQTSISCTESVPGCDLSQPSALESELKQSPPKLQKVSPAKSILPQSDTGSLTLLKPSP